MSPDQRFYPYFAAAAAMTMILALVFILDRVERERFSEQSRSGVLQQLSVMRSRVEGALNSRLYLTRSLAAYVAANPGIEKKEFARLAAEMIQRDPVIHTISLSEDAVISHICPLNGLEGVLGLDLMAHPERREIVGKTIRTRQSFVAGPVELVEGGIAFISYTPIFAAVAHGKRERGDFWGLTDMTIMMERLFKEAGLYFDSPALAVALRGRDGLGGTGEVFWGEEEVFAANPLLLPISLPNGEWQIAALPRGGWQAAGSPHLPVLWTAGAFIALFGGLLAWLLVRTPLRLRELVAQATGSLKEAEAELLEYQQKLEEMVRRRTAELEEANRQLTRLSAYKSQFLATMSHEIRTPLNAIIGLAGLALKSRGQGEAAVDEYLAMIKSAGDTLLAMISDILDLAGAEAGKLELNEVAFNPGEVIGRLLEPYAFAARRKGLSFEVEIDRAPSAVLGDPGRLAQVLVNLVGNALKFTEQGMIEVRMSGEGPLDGDEGRITLAFSVRDTGPGIPLEQQERIFESFTQADRTISGRYGGHGLGIAIAGSLVELMGGRLGLESAPGSGSAFSFTIKCRLPKEAAEKPAAGVVPQRLRAALKEKERLAILIADDNYFNQRLLADFLQLYGHRVTVAAGGLEAVARHAEGGYDLIFMDLLMAQMNGLAATRAIRTRENEEGRERVPIVAVTAGGRREEMEQCLDAGMDCYFAKPLDMEQLVAALGLARDAKAGGMPAGNGPRQGTAPPGYGPNSLREGRLLNEASLATLAGDRARIARYEFLLQQDLRQEMGRLAAAIKVGDTETARRAAHALKGLAANLRAGLLRDLAAELEQRFLEGETGEQAKLFARLQREYDQLVSAGDN